MAELKQINTFSNYGDDPVSQRSLNICKTQIQGILNEIDGYKVEIQKLKVHAQNKMDRATELAKIEALDCWIDGKIKT